MGNPNRIAEWREARGLSQEDLADAAGISSGYLSRMERGERNVSLKNLAKIAQALRVPERDLVTDTPTNSGLLPEATEVFRVPLGGRIVGGGAIDVSTAQHEPGLEYEIELSVRVPDATVAYQVVGESMMPVYRPDTVIICRAHTQDIEPLVGKELAVATVDHGRMLKTVHRGSKPGHYDLESFNASTMRDVRLEWVARIAAIIPADEWKILERRAQVQEYLKKPSQRRRPRSA
ncbi:LexA family transcriptional regulator [Methylobacterium sp. DB1607]|nr:LexA family transcriptional regulator [Methylobacterium sp. DB1607]